MDETEGKSAIAEKYLIAIETTRFILLQMSYGDLQKLPKPTQIELEEIKDRINFLLS